LKFQSQKIISKLQIKFCSRLILEKSNIQREIH
jgi:hypothetical protein